MKQVVQFVSSARAPYYKLSNFHVASITIESEDVPESVLRVNPSVADWIEEIGEATFPSAEHLWQSLKALNYGTWIKFLEDGEFGSLSVDFFAKVVLQTSRKNPNYDKWEAAQSKVRYWSSKNSVGIVACMAVNKTNRRKLGLTDDDIDYSSEDMDIDTLQDIWHFIHLAKYGQNPGLKEILLGTGNAYLLEFDKSAQRLANADKEAFWGGMLIGDLVVGRNMMGKMLMTARDSLNE